MLNQVIALFQFDSDKLSNGAEPDQTAVTSTPIWVCAVYYSITSEVLGIW